MAVFLRSPPATTNPGPNDLPALSRRRFLMAAALLAAVGAGSEREQFRAVLARHGFGAAERTLVVLELQGGNDGLNTLIPHGSSSYQDRRGALAIDPATVLGIDAEVGFHPSLSRLRARWDTGQVATVEGIGAADADTSHLAASGRWMAGVDDPSTATGWLGRYLDTVERPGLFDGVAIGGGVPLLLAGADRTGISVAPDAMAFGTSPDPDDQRLYQALRQLHTDTGTTGAAGRAVARATRDMLDVAATGASVPRIDLPDGNPQRELAFAARLLNARLGLRVVHVVAPGFDTHAHQADHHAGRLAAVDGGIDHFFRTLDPGLADRVALVVLSEFGRTLDVNGSGGTDHGSAGLALVVGSGVRGGRHGAAPSLARTDPGGRLRPEVEERSLFATLLGDWMEADDDRLLGRPAPHLDLFATDGTGDD